MCENVGVEGCRFAEGFRGDIGIPGDVVDVALVAEVGVEGA